MKANILVNYLFLFFICCSSYKNKENDFIIIETTYDKNNIETSRFEYNSSTGILLRYFQKFKIPYNEKDKQKIYLYLDSINIQNNSSCMRFDDGTSLKIDFESKKTSYKKDCSNDEKEFEKHLLLISEIREILQEKKEYELSFPNEFEKY